VPKYKAYMVTTTTYVASIEAADEDEALKLANDSDDWDLHSESGMDIEVELVK
jgi:hypothetical protein